MKKYATLKLGILSPPILGDEDSKKSLKPTPVFPCPSNCNLQLPGGAQKTQELWHLLWKFMGFLRADREISGGTWVAPINGLKQMGNWGENSIYNDRRGAHLVAFFDSQTWHFYYRKCTIIYHTWSIWDILRCW